ncbi:protein-export chaperone SecB [Marinibactrum halimedae]|uniref:Protein-export protein SecB n=1 Tax=Marinibactrum halimedae TaxID=1444977 RepID=A0AA37TAT3_9GAMM|nr:protein-export chaperone SecB [Marinibactrum halimedae]MCD9459311.1 protein-export chaperone SecB [Marinibactrum halimedae]GLS25797.1 protein-export protein SecB [Marinibactrum halimedae]
MAEEQQPAQPQEGAENNGPQFAMQRIYLRDFSFEAPMGAEAFRKQWKPKVGQELNTKTNKIEDNLYEVILTLTITVKIEEETAFLVEVQQAGLFSISGLEGQQLAQVMNTACPQILFPYAREAIDNVVTKGSFPALMLPPINFDALFAQALAQAKAKSEESSASVN